ncbi:Fic family protein [Microbacterium esteraromaticum]|uniref:Fic family protein n=1 Tax=Microbacterium esteraromaticum TaxID=57043 RepID=UPI001C946A13|nr:Fic family protein [Microbacterium esteraromaticum]MBY6060151.1 Fic family protein [Microbacterium esteraromaticum]
MNVRSGNRWTGALRRSTLARNVQGSNSIEGILASVDEVVAIAAGETPATVDEETEKALVGYQLAMTYVLQLAKGEFELDSSLIRSLHFMTTSYDMTKWPGRYRESPVYVVHDATGDIAHEGAQPEGLADVMKTFAASALGDEDPLIDAAMAHLNFVLVHPFKDGNGRMARIIQSLALARESDIAPVFMGIEEYLGRRTQAYYEVLAKVGQGNYSEADYDAQLAKPWIRFMLTAHLNQAREIEQRILSAGKAAQAMEALVEHTALPERVTQALYSAMFGNTVTRARYMAALEEAGEPVSEQTASRDLGALAKEGLLVAHGDKRGRRYAPSDIVKTASREAGLGFKWRDIDPFEMK